MTLLCKVCLRTKALRIADGFDTEEALVDHLEAVHHYRVSRLGETDEQAEERFRLEHPEAVGCPECNEARAKERL